MTPNPADPCGLLSLQRLPFATSFFLILPDDTHILTYNFILFTPYSMCYSITWFLGNSPYFTYGLAQILHGCIDLQNMCPCQIDMRKASTFFFHKKPSCHNYFSDFLCMHMRIYSLGRYPEKNVLCQITLLLKRHQQAISKGF